ncbi:MAG TPA: hypothetical protein VNO17_07610 [Actinomycetota bacterium]|nr:hypothetical protein [Actinomycetota bacterium]
MLDIQIASVRAPLDEPELLTPSLEALALAQAMGILPGDVRGGDLDLPTIRRVARAAGRAGVGAAAAARLAAEEPARDELRHALDALVEALRGSPLPEREWASLVDLLEPDRVARLVGVSTSSLRRYASGARRTPDEVAARLHFLATVVADLLGTYNAFGVRRWFERPRSALGGRSPADVLAGDWDPEDEGPLAVRALARSLVGSSAT